MKINDEQSNIETSGDMDEQFFSIQDQGMIFDILRNKMYSDPILAICREISCNARDAHREAGKSDLPIEITLPSHLEPFYKIKDFGPGISPDRMSNVFIKYTASTKRNDNLQTGGFGLGAKTPFSYSDTFTITTVVDKIKYNYACFIDETKVGKLILMGKESCDEENNTEIEIPVKSSDITKFYSSTEQATRHWEVKPIIKNGELKWVNYEFTLTGSNWKIAKTKYDLNAYSSYNQQYERGLKILVDGIEYQISMEAVKKFTDSTIIDACKGFLFLYFNIGELSLSANRESVYIDKKTEAKIIARLDVIKKEISGVILNKIESYSNYIDANTYFFRELHFMFNDLSFLGPLSWQGIKLYGPSIKIFDSTILNFYKSKILRGKQYGTEKIRTKSSYLLEVNHKDSIYFNDLGFDTISFKHVKKSFDEGSESVQVITPKNGKTFEDLEKIYSLTKIGCKLLSSITNAAIQNKKITADKMLVFKVRSGYYNSNYDQVPYCSIKKDLNKTKVLCFFDRSKNVYGKQYKEIYLNENKNHQDRLTALYGEFKNDTSFYAIQKDTSADKIKKYFKDFISLEDFVNDNLINANIDYIGIKTVCKISTYDFYNENFTQNLIKQIKDPNSLFLKRIYAINKVSKLKEKKSLVALYEALTKPISELEMKIWIKNNPDFDLETISDKCKEKYPLLRNYDLDNVKVEHVSQYINFIDSI